MPAVREYLDSRTVQTKPTTRRTMELLEVTRNSNYFEFGEHLYKQEGGTSIGKKHAPDTACLGAGKFEEETIFPSERFQNIVLKDNSSMDVKDRFYKRFIDDMIAATNCTQQEANNFVDWLNTLNPSLNFTFEWSNESINYLDVTLVMKDGKLETDRHETHESTAFPSLQFKSSTVCFQIYSLWASHYSENHMLQGRIC